MSSLSGRFFPTLVKEPSKYIHKQPLLRKTLRALKKHKKYLFIASNHHHSYIELLMKMTLGQDWAKFFDVVIANC